MIDLAMIVRFGLSMCWMISIEVDLSLPSARVIRSLDQIIEWRGKPQQNAYVERYNLTVQH